MIAELSLKITIQTEGHVRYGRIALLFKYLKFQILDSQGTQYEKYKFHFVEFFRPFYIWWKPYIVGRISLDPRIQ